MDTADSARPPAGLPEAWKQVLDQVETLLRESLPEKLRFATVADVTRLLRNEVEGGLKKQWRDGASLPGPPATGPDREDWLREQAARLATRAIEAGDHEDCDRAVEFGQGRTPDARREEIQAWFWQRYHPRLSSTLGKRFTDRFPRSSSDSPECQQVTDKALSVLMVASEFGALVRKYDPARGGVFRRFLFQHVEWRGDDAMRGIDPAGLAHPEVEGDERTEVEAPAPDDSDHWAACLARCAREMPDDEERAVFELRYLAHIAPHSYSATTRARLGKEALDQLVAEHSRCRGELLQLAGIDLPEARGKWRELREDQENRRQDLEALGISRDAVEDLGQDALGLKVKELQQLEQQAKKHGSFLQQVSRAWQIAFLRADAARRKLERLEDQLARYRNLMAPWVRSQQQLAGRLDFSQPKASRLLEAALRHLLEARQEGRLPECNDPAAASGGPGE